jgi:hypothetical protein
MILLQYVNDDSSSRLNVPNEGMAIAGDNSAEGYLIENIVGHKKEGGKIMYLVKWVGYPTEYNTWEPFVNIVKPASRLIENYLSRKNLDIKKWKPKVRRSKQN